MPRDTLPSPRHAHPHATEAEIVMMERRHRLGSQLADAAWPPSTERAP